MQAYCKDWNVTQSLAKLIERRAGPITGSQTSSGPLGAETASASWNVRADATTLNRGFAARNASTRWVLPSARCQPRSRHRDQHVWRCCRMAKVFASRLCIEDCQGGEADFYVMTALINPHGGFLSMEERSRALARYTGAPLLDLATEPYPKAKKGPLGATSTKTTGETEKPRFKKGST